MINVIGKLLLGINGILVDVLHHALKHLVITLVGDDDDLIGRRREHYEVATHLVGDLIHNTGIEKCSRTIYHRLIGDDHHLVHTGSRSIGELICHNIRHHVGDNVIHGINLYRHYFRCTFHRILEKLLFGNTIVIKKILVHDGARHAVRTLINCDVAGDNKIIHDLMRRGVYKIFVLLGVTYTDEEMLLCLIIIHKPGHILKVLGRLGLKHVGNVIHYLVKRLAVLIILEECVEISGRSCHLTFRSYGKRIVGHTDLAYLCDRYLRILVFIREIILDYCFYFLLKLVVIHIVHKKYLH